MHGQVCKQVILTSLLCLVAMSARTSDLPSRVEVFLEPDSPTRSGALVSARLHLQSVGCGETPDFSVTNLKIHAVDKDGYPTPFEPGPDLTLCDWPRSTSALAEPVLFCQSFSQRRILGYLKKPGTYFVSGSIDVLLDGNSYTIAVNPINSLRVVP